MVCSAEIVFDATHTVVSTIAQLVTILPHTFFPQFLSVWKSSNRLSFCEFYYVRINKTCKYRCSGRLGQKHGIYVVLCTWHQKTTVYLQRCWHTNIRKHWYLRSFEHVAGWFCSCKSYRNTIPRKFKSQTSDNMDRWKSRGGKSQRRERKKKEDQRRERQKKEDQGVRKGWKVAKHPVFRMFCGSRRSKSRLAKAAGAEPSRQMRDRAKQISQSKSQKHFMLGALRDVEMLKKCMALWREAHFEVKTYKTHHGRIIFGSGEV